MMFNKNSAIVKTWLRLIETGRKTYADVPNISNLREVIGEILNQ